MIEGVLVMNNQLLLRTYTSRLSTNVNDNLGDVLPRSLAY